MISDPVYEKFRSRTIRDHKIASNIPWRDSCWGCRTLKVRAYYTEDGYAVGTAFTGSSLNGFPNVTHGGVLVSYFDEVCWYQTKKKDASINAMTIEINVHYWHPVAENTNVLIVAEPARIEGRHWYVDAMILDGETICCTASVHYLALKEGTALADREYRRIMHEWKPELTSIRF